jgi:hypothetical protein
MSRHPDRQGAVAGCGGAARLRRSGPGHPTAGRLAGRRAHRGDRVLHGRRVRPGASPGRGFAASSGNYGGCPKDAERLLPGRAPSWPATASRTAPRRATGRQRGASRNQAVPGGRPQIPQRPPARGHDPADGGAEQADGADVRIAGRRCSHGPAWAAAAGGRPRWADVASAILHVGQLRRGGGPRGRRTIDSTGPGQLGSSLTWKLRWVRGGGWMSSGRHPAEVAHDPGNGPPQAGGTVVELAVVALGVDVGPRQIRCGSWGNEQERWTPCSGILDSEGWGCS